jgi:peroxiredoxin
MKIISYLLLASILFGTSSDDETASTVTKIGQNAPDFTIQTLDGGKFNLSELRGRVVLLNFFATWCSPCLTELPHLELEIWRKFKNDNFILLAIGRGHTKRELVRFINSVEFTFPMAPDVKWDIYGKFATKYIPRNVVIDQHGKIIYQSVGYSEEELKKMTELIERTVKITNFD